jgi:hypothetical protein
MIGLHRRRWGVARGCAADRRRPIGSSIGTATGARAEGRNPVAAWMSLLAARRLPIALSSQSRSGSAAAIAGDRTPNRCWANCRVGRAREGGTFGETTGEVGAKVGPDFQSQPPFGGGLSSAARCPRAGPKDANESARCEDGAGSDEAPNLPRDSGVVVDRLGGRSCTRRGYAHRSAGGGRGSGRILGDH